mmetsp:Transcript_29121/g.87052  ORF Transcript_29121/g.87052 Transcript_29121/m.87052 type:complete len:344 (+) Transcript_29121:518-1549(+)
MRRVGVQELHDLAGLGRGLHLAAEDRAERAHGAQQRPAQGHEGVQVRLRPARRPRLGPPQEEERHGGAHRVAHEDGLLAVRVHEELDLRLEPREVRVALLKPPVAQAPVVAGHVHGAPIIPNGREVLQDLGPEPVPRHEVVGAREALGRAHFVARGVEARLRVQRHVVQPAGDVRDHRARHGQPAPDARAEVVAPEALAGPPEFEAARDDARHEQNGVLRRRGDGSGGLRLGIEVRVHVRVDPLEALEQVLRAFGDVRPRLHVFFHPHERHPGRGERGDGGGGQQPPVRRRLRRWWRRVRRGRRRRWKGSFYRSAPLARRVYGRPSAQFCRGGGCHGFVQCGV